MLKVLINKHSGSHINVTANGSALSIIRFAIHFSSQLSLSSLKGMVIHCVMCCKLHLHGNLPPPIEELSVNNSVSP